MLSFFQSSKDLYLHLNCAKLSVYTEERRAQLRKLPYELWGGRGGGEETILFLLLLPSK